MSRHNRRSADIGLSAITVEGGLIAPAQIALIAATTPDLKAAQDYGCPKGTNLRDEITRYFRITQAHWQSYARIEQPNSVQTSLFVKSLLEDGFGFGALTGPHRHHLDDHDYRITFEGRGGRVPIVVAAPIPDADAFTKSLPELGDNEGGTIARRSPVVLLQDWLNANDNTLWGLCFAGDRLRLMRDNASITRQAYIEADLGAIFRDEMFADFTALWLMIHATRFGSENAADKDCPLERWRVAGQQAGTAARNRLRINVEDALEALGQGVLDANPDFRARLDASALSMNIWFEQLLRIVYRMIFMAVAEDRDLLHGRNVSPQARALYREAYGFDYLRERSGRRAAHDHHHDAWEGLKITFAALEHGERQLALPALGGLFSSDLTRDINDLKLPNKALLAAVFRLSFLIDNGQRVRINWRDMATEELGSVYESLLELVPIREQQGRVFAFAGGAETKGNSRKVSGSYYTPDSLVQALLDTTLNPVLDKAEAEGGAEAILALNVIDPACGSGHFLLGAARRMATRVAQLRDPDAPDYNGAMRDVVRNCIHGVDRNPMAVELTKVALWIETVEPGKPLGFLDANIRCGDSLLGVFDLKLLEKGIPDGAYKPLTGDDKEAAKLAGKVNKQQRESKNHDLFATADAADLAAAAKKLHDMAEDSPAQLKAKADAFASLRKGKNWWAKKTACDLYIAAFLRPKRFRQSDMATSKALDLVPTTLDVRNALAGSQGNPQLTAMAIDLASIAYAFHWPMEFADVMAAGGFDIVIGNPPWEVAQINDKEFFAARMPEIASLEGGNRKRAINLLEKTDPMLWNQFTILQRTNESFAEFVRSSERFPLTSNGKANLYSLFAEISISINKSGGRAGLIIQSGIVSDQVNSTFFKYIVDKNRLVSVFDMVNTEGIFPGIHRTHPHFSLFTTSGSPHSGAAFASFHNTNTQHLGDGRRIFSISASDLKLFNPNTSTCPIFRSQRDYEISKKMYLRHPILLEEAGGLNVNTWNISIIQNFFSHTNDSVHFKLSSEVSRNSISDRNDTESHSPLYEGKMVDMYDHRFGSFDTRGDDRGNRVLPQTNIECYQDYNFEVKPHFWVHDSELENRINQKSLNTDWMFVWKDITTSITERTVKASIIPLTATDDTLSVINFDTNDIWRAGLLLANLNSIPLDYIARQKVNGVHLRKNVLAQLPIVDWRSYSRSEVEFVNSRVAKLVNTSASVMRFVSDIGFIGTKLEWDEAHRMLLRCELDAFFSIKYGLTREELCFILNPADVATEDYPSETFRILKSREIKALGEYRTRNLVLDAYDKLVAEK